MTDLTKVESYLLDAKRAAWPPKGAALIPIGSVILTLTSSWNLFRWAGVVISGLGFIAWSWQGVRNQRSLREAQDEGRARVITDNLDTLLRDFLVDLKLDTNDTRMSLFAHVDAGFSLLARASADPILATTGREIYPEDQGVLGKAWRAGQNAVSALPKDRQKWNAAQVEEYKFSPEEAAALTMQSRSLVGFRLSTVDQAFGVLVLEDLRAGPKATSIFTRDQLNRVTAADDPFIKLIRTITARALEGLNSDQIRAIKPNFDGPRRSTVTPPPKTH